MKSFKNQDRRPNKEKDENEMIIIITVIFMVMMCGL